MTKKVRNLIFAGIGLVLLVGVLLLLMFLPKKETETASSESSSSYVSESVNVYERKTDEVQSIQLDNPAGGYTIDRESVDLYSIKALSDYTQNSSLLSSMASQVSILTAMRLVEENAPDLQKYGLSSPTITMTVTFTDNTKNVVMFGENLPTGDGMYGMVEGNKNVYAFGSSEINSIDLNALQFLDTNLIDPWEAPTSSDNSAAAPSAPDIAYLEIEGGTFGDKIFRAESVSLSEEFADVGMSTTGYRITSPFDADFKVRTNDQGEDLNGGFFTGLQQLDTDHVAAVAPTEAQLTEFGLAEPYGKIRFDRDGKDYEWIVGGKTETLNGAEARYIMTKGRDVVYVVMVSMLPWMTADINDLYSSLTILPFIDDVNKIDITIGDKTYLIETTGTGDDLAATINGNPFLIEKDATTYRKFYQFLLSAPAEGVNDGSQETGETIARFVYHYSDPAKSGKDSEVIEFKKLTDRTCVLSVNGNDSFLTRKVYVDALLKNCERAVNGEAPVMDY